MFFFHMRNCSLSSLDTFIKFHQLFNFYPIKLKIFYPEVWFHF